MSKSITDRMSCIMFLEVTVTISLNTAEIEELKCRHSSLVSFPVVYKNAPVSQLYASKSKSSIMNRSCTSVVIDQ